MPMHEITIVPTLRTIARHVLASYHATRGMVQSILSLSSSGKLHWQFPNSSTEVRFLGVLKNKVSDTRGTEPLLQEISLGFLRDFYLSTSSESQNSFSSTPPTMCCFPMTQGNRKRLTKTTLHFMLHL